MQELGSHDESEIEHERNAKNMFCSLIKDFCDYTSAQEDNGGDTLGAKSTLDHAPLGCDDDYDDSSERFVPKIPKPASDYLGHS